MKKYNKKGKKKNKKRLGVGLCQCGYWLGLEGRGLGESFGWVLGVGKGSFGNF